MALSAIVLAGCAVGPDYHAPVLKTATEFHSASLLESRQITAAAPLENWWVGFGDPTLERVIDAAVRQNLELAQAVARVTQAGAITQSARAALLPAGQVSGQAATTHASLEDPLGRLGSASPGFDRNGKLYNLGIGASWEVDVFGGLRRGAEAAQADYESAQAAASAARLTIIAETADTYLLLRTLQARLALAQQQAATQQHRVELARLRYSRGIAPELELRQAEGELATTAARVPQLEVGLVAARNGLDVLMGVAPGTEDAQLQNVAPIPAAPAVQTAGGPAALIRRRPDIVVAERKLAASNARIGEAVSDYYPKFSLSGLIGTATTAGGDVFTANTLLAQGVAGLHWRLFDFGRVDAEVKAAKGKNAEALAAYRQSVLVATEEVEDALTALVKLEAQEALLSNGEQALGRARESALAAYQAGQQSYLQVLDADDRLQRTQDARIVAQSDAARAAVETFRSLGGGWEPQMTHAETAAQSSARSQ
ncbi:efflux transporter outer membrane subunit [Paraburkholderia sediminicola]|uniref:efflux transporter outer membrane subunit n=1 Tax=Paraburkholderia sediminicola TaxID=458836 RepID=UPI0038B7E6CD